MQHRTYAAAILAPAALALIAACGGGATNPAATGTGAPAADGGSYPDTTAILAALNAHALPCTAPSPVANPTVPGATSMTQCVSDTSALSNTVISVYGNHDQAMAAAATLAHSGLLQITNTLLVGRDWLINTDDSGYGNAVQLALGGQSVPVASPAAAP